MHFNDSEHCGHSIDDGSLSLNKLQQDEESKDPLEDVDLNAIGSLLPDDEDELLAGIMDDFDLSGLPTPVEDLEDDLFGSGGMELDFDIGISKLSLSWILMARIPGIHLQLLSMLKSCMPAMEGWRALALSLWTIWLDNLT